MERLVAAIGEKAERAGVKKGPGAAGRPQRTVYTPPPLVKLTQVARPVARRSELRRQVALEKGGSDE
jgi:hypothetical protein